MRTIFSVEDTKNVVDKIFNGNLWLSTLKNGKENYINENSENIVIIDEDDGSQSKKDLAEYLNVKFYTWKNRLYDNNENYLSDSQYSNFDNRVSSLNFSLNEAYALVDIIEEEVTESQDIDNAVKNGRITFLIQSDKAKNLDYYIAKIRNKFLGLPQEIQNSYGNVIKAYILFGILIYEEEPIQTQLGECLKIVCNFKISYLANALTYNDTKVLLSLNGDDEYDLDGNVIGLTKYLEVPLTKQTWQLIFSDTPLPTSTRPDLTGFIATSVSQVKTLTFFDFNMAFTLQLNDIFWKTSAYRIDGVLSVVKDINIPIYIKVVSNNHSYVFKDMISKMEKVLTNSDFNISSITLKGYGKVGV